MPKSTRTTVLELPVVTHFSRGSGGFSYLATDAPELIAPSPAPLPLEKNSYFYLNQRLPDFGSYIADIHADRAVPDDIAREFLGAASSECGLPVDFLRPDAFNCRKDGPGRLRSNSGAVQIVHAKIIDGSLATFILPPNWCFGQPEGTYPILFNGFYDINQNLFELEGQRWIKAVAWSGSAGRSGAIGVLWNGGGALGSRSIGRHAFAQFYAVVHFASAELGGDRHRIVTSGISRGGLTAIGMASNPYGYDYRIVFSAPSATPSRLGDHATMMSTTYPAMLLAAPWSIGFADAWQEGWTYPAAAGRPYLTGVNAAQAHAYILTGTTDLHEATRNFSPLSDRFIEGLRNAGTQLHLEVTGHDNICMYSHQVELGHRLLRENFPVHVDVLIRAGHNERRDDGLLGRKPVRFNRMMDALSFLVGEPEGPKHTPGISFYAFDRRAGDFATFAEAVIFHGKRTWYRTR